MPKNQIYGHLASLLFSLLVAGSFSLGGIVANLVPPEVVTALRFSIAALIVGFIAIVTGQLKLGQLSKSGLSSSWRFLVLGVLFAIYFVSMFEGLKTASPISTSAVFTLAPPLSALFGYFLLKQITTSRMAFALSIGAFGALWVIFRADIQAVLNFNVGRGEMVYFVGVICHAFYIPLFRKFNRGEPVIVSSLGVLIGGMIVLWLYSFDKALQVDWASLPAIFWWTVAYISIFASAMTFFLLQYSAMQIASAKAMAYTYLIPTWVIIWEWALGNGLPSLAIGIGIALTIVALIILLKNEE